MKKSNSTEFTTFTLPNGIRCIFKRTNSPVAYSALTIGAGSRDELDGEAGIAHFTEHLLFKGTKRRKAHHINNRLEKLGGELNAFTTKEETVVHATTLRTDLTKAVELISDIAFNSIYPEREILREKEVVLDEINSCKDSPSERIYDEFEDIIFSGSSLGHNILGTRRSVSKFNSADIARFTARCYNTDQMIFSVAANITEFAFRRVAETYLSHFPSSYREFARTVPPALDRFDKTIHRNTYQAHCIMGSRAYGNNDKRRVALALLTNYLGGPAANSRLNTVLREKNGLTYNIEASYLSYCDSGLVTIYFGTDKDKIDYSTELVEKVLNEVRSTALSPRQLHAAKKQFSGQLAIAMENKESYMLSAAKSLLVYNEVDSLPQLYSKIDSVTASVIMEVANDIFSDTSYLIYN